MCVNLHTHDHKGSVLDAIAKPEDIVKRIKELGQTAYAITNHGSTSSLLTHYKLAKKAGLKFVFGVEAYITKDITIKEKFDYQHICLWAKNFTGYKNILKLTTVAYDKGFYYKPRIDWNTLMNYKEGLIVGSACLGGILGIKDDKGGFDRQKIYETAKKYHDEFGEDFYIELHTNQMPEQLEFNRLLVDISRIFTERGIDIATIHSRTSKQGIATIDISFGVKSRGELAGLIEKLRQVESVIDIERAVG